MSVSKTTKKVYEDAFNVFGEKFQVLKAIEEHLELAIELVKYLVGKGDRKHIIEELNDSMITTEQMLMLFNVKREELTKERFFKINRLRRNIREQGYANRQIDKGIGIEENKQ